MADASSVDFRALQLFIAVYDNQSFSVVARREGVSPSLISRTIQQLEDALGQQLFYRNTRAVVPTEAGRLFAASARTAGTVRRRATGVTGSGTGPWRAGADQCAGLFWSAAYRPWLPELAALHPKLQFDLTLTDDFIDPHRDATDILFRISSLPDAGYHARVFGSQRYYLTASWSMFHGTAARLRRRHCINIARWCMAVRREPTAGCFASAKRHGCTIR